MTQAQTPGRVIWCLGMYASASTWLFNVVSQILEATQMDKDKMQVIFVSGKEKNLALGGPGTVTLIKSHEISSDARIVDVARHCGKILITMRNPRDAVASLMQAHKYDFCHALDFVEQSARLCRSFAKDRRARTFLYETGFFETPDTVTIIARHLGYELLDDVTLSIFNALTRSEVEKHISQMPKMSGILRDAKSGDLLDAKTQWHSHHAGRNGEIGKWQKLLTATQVGEVERRLSD